MGTANTNHKMLPYKDGKRRACVVCSRLTGSKIKQRRCCITCEKSFHVESFAVFYYLGILQDQRATLRDMIIKFANISQSRTSGFIPEALANELPCLEKFRQLTARGL